MDEISDYVDASFSEQYSNKNSGEEESNDTVSQHFSFAHIPDAPFKAIEEVPEIYEFSPMTTPMTSDRLLVFKSPKAVSPRDDQTF